MWWVGLALLLGAAGAWLDRSHGVAVAADPTPAAR
jgi:hypothetical protein